MHLRRFALLSLLTALFALAAAGASADELASRNLPIVGRSLTVVESLETGTDIAAYVQTKLGGRMNEEVTDAAGMSVLGDLRGPDFPVALTLRTTPGGAFQLPLIHQPGEYVLENIRLLDASGAFLQPATPAATRITVKSLVGTNVTVRQLTPEELRARGINIDERTFDAYEYTFTFATKPGETVTIPYPVIVDRRTHEVVQPPAPSPYPLPAPQLAGPPPRFQPPAVLTTFLDDTPAGGDTPAAPATPDFTPRKRRPSIPAAIVLPTGFGVLHQFFAVILNVTNNASAGSGIELHSVTATLETPGAMRVSKVVPAVAIGQAVPIEDKATHAAFLVAAAEGSAEWTLESLRAGTHTLKLNIQATYRQAGQPDVPLSGRAEATIVVSDPRFQINFVHPDVVRKDNAYTAYAFITNTSETSQTVRLNTPDIPACSGGLSTLNVCLTEPLSDSGACRPLADRPGVLECTLASGVTAPVAYKLKSGINGRVFAAAGNSDAPADLGIALTMGVSVTGIPLSPATLVLPHYANYVAADLVNASLGLLGLGYSLATAPLNAKTAALPRVIRNDVFQRAQDIARAGQRMFVTRADAATGRPAEDREAVIGLALDLLGNVERIDRLATTPDLAEWDQLRRMQEEGRAAGAAMARELERVSVGLSVTQLVKEFAKTASHRSPFLLASVHGPAVSGASRPYALTVAGSAPDALLSVPDGVGGTWKRGIPYGDLMTLNLGEPGELAIVGRWKESLRFSIIPASSQFTIDLIYPDAANGFSLTTSFNVTNANPKGISFSVERGSRTVIVTGGTAVPLVEAVAQTPLALGGAAQDLFLDDAGHVVSLLFNRPVKAADLATLRDLFSLTTRVPGLSYAPRIENDARNGVIVVPGASLQDDGRIVNVSFDKALSTNAAYTIGMQPIADLLDPARTFSSASIVPRIDNRRPAGSVYGKLLQGDNTEVRGAAVQLFDGKSSQYARTSNAGEFLFEFVPRDVENGFPGNYELSASADGKYTKASGTVRLPGEVQNVNLMFLGRGHVRGIVRSSDGRPLANVPVTIGNTAFNTLFREFLRATTDANGAYTVTDVPVGPLTIAATDASGNVVFAANLLRTPGEVLTQDLVFQARALAGFARVRVTVRRSDMKDAQNLLLPVAGARVGVYAQGYGLLDGVTDANGQFVFDKVPAGFISVLAAEFNLTRESAGVDFDVKPDTFVDQTLVLHVPTAVEQAQLASVKVKVKRSTTDQPVAGAVVTIRGYASGTTDASGESLLPGIATSLGGKNVVDVFDPSTGQRGTFALPSLQPGPDNNLVVFLSDAPQQQGTATLRVKLVSATGEPVNSGYDVLWPGFPPDRFTFKADGVYEWANVQVPRVVDVWAVPVGRHPLYGDQIAHGTVRADFAGQVSTLELRLPGQGTIPTKIEVKQSCSSTPCQEWRPASGTVAVTYTVWSPSEQELQRVERLVPADNTTLVANVTGVPVGVPVTVETVDHPAGYAAKEVRLTYNNQPLPVTLQLSSVGDVSGRVLNYDGRTPVAGAPVRLTGASSSYDPKTTSFDGTFRFPAIAADQSFRLTAEVNLDGVWRMGFVDGRTPRGGGPVSDLVILLPQQASVEGTIVDADNRPLDRPYYWVQSLTWPYRSLGSAQNPLEAGANGQFRVGNLFAGGFRVSVRSRTNPDLGGQYQGVIESEGRDVTGVSIRVGGAGIGSAAITVYDANSARRANAEVTLLRNGAPFDITTTNANGIAYFQNVPVGSGYSARAFARAVSLGGKTAQDFAIAKDLESAAQITLDFLGEVQGTLVDADVTPAVPVVSAPVTLTSGALQTHASSDRSGTFRFIGVPEGHFNLDAVDLDSGRTARSEDDPQLRDVAFVDRLSAPTRVLPVPLKLEKTARLNVRVHLPDDAGYAGPLAPLVSVKVTQTRYLRESQSSSATFEKMFARDGFKVVATEFGGENRSVVYEGLFGGAFEKDVVLVFPQSGSVQVTVRNADGTPAADAHVTLAAANKSADFFAGPTGVLGPIPGFALNSTITAQAVRRIGSVDYAASAAGRIESRSSVLSLQLTLANDTASVRGFVEAEEGAGLPSAGTRVTADVTSSALIQALHLETRTDASGNYQFNYISTANTSIQFGYFGPDDVTLGASQRVSGTGLMPAVKLDATPPRVLAISPENNANAVSPNSHIIVVFSEAIDPAGYNTNDFMLVSTDDGRTVPATVAPEPASPQRIHLIPQSLLRSHVVYTLRVGDAIRDLRGNRMRAAVGSAFTTVDYTEPKITSVDPNPAATIPPEAKQFRLHFNKPVDVASGAVRLERLSTYKGAVVAVLATSVYLDPVEPATIVVAPVGTGIEPASFYRLTASGFRDTQTPSNTQKEAQLFDFVSYDAVVPVVSITAPATGTALTAGRAYTASVSITDSGTTAESRDIDYVEWFVSDGTTERVVKVSTPPFSYLFAAPKVTAASKFTLRASATDFSKNSSAIATATWDVNPNQAPSDVAVAATPAAVYLGGHVDVDVTFKDDDDAATVTLQAIGKKLDGSDYVVPAASIKPSSLQEVVLRNGAWVPSPVRFGVDLPTDLKEGEPVRFTATVTDAARQATAGTASVALTTDTVKPQAVALTTTPQDPYRYGQSYTITAKFRDLESGLARVVFAFDGKSTEIKRGGTGWSYDIASGVYTVSLPVTTPAKNSDTRVTITATGYDFHGNDTPQSVEVVYLRLDDPTIPFAAWVSPLDGAALPAGQPVSVKLRVRATDNEPATLAVSFTSDAFPAPLAASRVGTSDLFEAVATLNPVAGTPLVITATVRDSDPTHDVVLPITIAPLAFTADDPPAIAGALAITAANVAQYQNRNVVVRGSEARLHVNVPLAVRNLLVLDGGVVSAAEQTRLELTVAERLYIDGDSRIDLTDKGYLGGWGTRADGTRNNDVRGMTVGGSTSDGAAGGAGGSHAGIGNTSPDATTNATYGSLQSPAEFGSGGSGSTSGAVGGNGGGAVSVTALVDGSRVVVAGGIRADGNAGYAGGSGGSILLNARSFTAGAAARITVNGGDSEAGAGGGGRIALLVSERIDLDRTSPILQARGGIGTTMDGGAGTIVVRQPRQTDGELLITAFDGVPSTRLTRATPVAGTPKFDLLTAGPRALVRFDSAYTVAAKSIDPTALVLEPGDQPAITLNATAPAAGASLIQATSLVATYSASTAPGDGIDHVRLVFTPGGKVETFAYPSSLAGRQTSLAIPAATGPGPVTLVVRVTDRAGRTAETAASSYTIVANAPPVVSLDVTSPSSLQMYAGHAIEATLSATDDVGLTPAPVLTSSAGTVRAKGSAVSIPNGISQQYAIDIPATTPSGTSVLLTATASDGFPGRAPVTATRTVAIVKDTVAPSVTITQPVPPVTYKASATATIPIRVTATDADVAVKEVWITIDNGTPIVFSADPTVQNGYKADVPVPQIESKTTVTKQIVAYAKDYDGNVGNSTAVPIQIEPVVDPNGPTLTWLYPSSGAMYPAGYAAKMRVSAVGSSAQNAVTAVAFYSPASSQTAVAATSVGSNQWEATVPIPAGNDGDAITVKVVATSFLNNTTVEYTSIVIVTGTELTQDTTISPTNTSYDGPSKTLIIRSGTTTIDGPHSFKRLIVLDGAKLTHSPTTAAGVGSLLIGDMTSRPNVYVSGLGRIDVSGRGYTGYVNGYGYTWPNTTVGGSYRYSGGSHGGQGGLFTDGFVAASYGSVYDPNEPGGSGGFGSGAACGDCFAGGGIVRIQSETLLLDGKILANGLTNGPNSYAAGAGGSVRIDAKTVAGTGEIHADGGGVFADKNRAGGGGRVAINYETMTLDRSKVTAAGGGGDTPGSAGTVYLKSAAASSPNGDLIIDNIGRVTAQATELPSLGSGTVVSVSGNAVTTDRASAISSYFVGHWVEIGKPDGTLRGTWRIGQIGTDGKTITLLPNGNLPVDVAAGDRWQGVYRFDRISAPHGEAINSGDPIRLGVDGVVVLTGPTVDGQFLTLKDSLKATNVTISGNVALPSITSANLTLKSGSVLTTSRTGTAPYTIGVIVTGTVLIENGARIDVSGRGYTGYVNGYGYTWPNTTVGGSYRYSGGSHGGQGGLFTDGFVAASYGSVYDPNEPGGSGGFGSGAACGDCFAGGGIVRIQSETLLLDGKILVNGLTNGPNSYAAGAGGTVRIDAKTVAGTGEIHADGGGVFADKNRAGGGGRVAINYETMTLDRSKVTAAGGGGDTPGSAGTVYLKSAAASSPNGDLIIDNIGRVTAQATELPSLGSGTVVSVSGNAVTTDRASAISSYFVGHWVEIGKPDGTLRGTWRIGQIGTDGKTITLLPNGNLPVDVAAGDRWRGVYRFDNVKLRGTTVKSVDPVISTNPIDTDGSKISSVASIGTIQGSAKPVEELIPPVSSRAGAVLVGVAVDRAAVASGNRVLVTLRLDGGAPPAGAVVAMSSSHPSVIQVPETLFMPAGQQSMTLELVVAQVSAPVSVRIIAVYGNTLDSFVMVEPSTGSSVERPDVTGRTVTTAQPLAPSVAPGRNVRPSNRP